MKSLVIKKLPDDVHGWLKQEAKRNRRSATQEAVLILERALRPLPPVPRPTPIKPLRPFTQEWLSKAIREGRE